MTSLNFDKNIFFDNSFSYQKIIILFSLPLLALVLSFKNLEIILSIYHLDDALFFIRYAHNFWEGYGIAFNKYDLPSYGPTSLIHQFSVVVFYPLFGLYSSFAASFFYVIVSIFLFQKFKLSFFILSFVVIFFASITGMETGLSLAVILFILQSIFLGNFRFYFYGLAYLTRPDLLLVAGGLHAYFLYKKYGLKEVFVKQAFISISSNILFLFALLVCLGLYFGSPFPLGAYVKSLQIFYSNDNEAIDFLRYANIGELFSYFGLLILLASLMLILNLVKTSDFKNSIFPQTIILVTLLAFSLYHAFGVEFPVLTGGARYFLPTVPLLSLIIHESSLNLFKKSKLKEIKNFLVLFLSLSILFVSIGGLTLTKGLIDIHKSSALIETRKGYDFVLEKGIKNNRWPIWLIKNKQLSNCSIADTELGVIGVLNFDRKILDASGLTNRKLILSDESLMDQINSSKIDIINKKFVIDLYKLVSAEDLENYVQIDTVLVRKDSSCLEIINKEKLNYFNSTKVF